MSNVAKVEQWTLELPTHVAKMHEDALVKAINFRFDFSRVLSDVLKLRWAKHIHQFKEGFQPSRETLMKENVKLPWAKCMYTFNAFHVVQVNPFTAVGPNKGGHFRVSMEKKYGTERFDRLLERNAVKRILQPFCCTGSKSCISSSVLQFSLIKTFALSSSRVQLAAKFGEINCEQHVCTVGIDRSSLPNGRVWSLSHIRNVALLPHCFTSTACVAPSSTFLHGLHGACLYQ